MTDPSAWFGGRYATGLADVVDLNEHPEALDTSGWWAVLVTFEGVATGWRFTDVRPAPLPVGPGTVARVGDWSSSLTDAEYRDGVRLIREHIRQGRVYQVNLCRVLSAPVTGFAPYPLADRLAAGNPAPFAGVLDVPGVQVVSASPELSIRRDGDQLTSGPIKGTAASADLLLDKDTHENVMIVDLVRNDLHRICRPETVAVPGLLEVQEHPGLVHLVSTVTGQLADGVGWRQILDALTPAGSVSGAPKSTALQVISELEPVPRGPYCGAIGWVDADRSTAELAVGIRTFWHVDGVLRFGTGAGITWGSDPAAEWAETELKARRLLSLTR